MSASVWGLPLLVLASGAAAGVFLAVRTRGGTTDLSRSRRTDESQEYAEALTALKALEQEQDKLEPAEYTAQRTELMNRAANALRRLEDPSMTVADPIERVRAHLESQRPLLGDDAVDAALARLSGGTAAPSAPESAPTISPAWLGALYALLGVGILGGLYLAVSGQSVERIAGAPITGLDPSEMSQSAGPQRSMPPAQVPPEVIALRQRVEADPTDIEAHNLLTEYAIGAQDLSSAMSHNGEVLKIDPENADGRVYRAYLMMSIGRTTEAIDALETLLAEQPDNIKASIYYGLMTLTAGDTDKAIPALERAVAAEPEGVEFLRERLAAARALAEGGPPPEAGDAPTESLSRIAAGQIRLDPALAATLQPGDQLFISVRSPSGGPPLAAQKLTAADFPMDFDLTTADRIRMGGDAPMPPLVDLSIRIDRDGNAMTREPGLPAATVRGVSVGARELFVELVAGE